MDNFDDIPVAVRETRPQTTSKRNRRVFWIAGLSATAVGLLGGISVALLPFLNNQKETVIPITGENTTLDPSTPITSGAKPTSESFVDATDSRSSASSAEPRSPERESILGHYAYEEISSEQLQAIAPGISLAKAASDAYLKMEAAARADGIGLVPLSGFRSKADQEYLFFEVKGERGQTAEERAKVSAPPGHSEHHTGYALDIGDAEMGANLTESFEESRAFKWLEQNAPYYSFELSFPRSNDQGVSYEPWHWRYVGNQESLEIFHKGR